MQLVIQNAILRNLLDEALRVYDTQTGGEPAVEPSGAAARSLDDTVNRRAGQRGVVLKEFGGGDPRIENVILRRLLTTTGRAYEERQHVLESETGLLDHLLKVVSDVVLATDASGVVTHLNPRAEELTGWNLEEALGLPVAEVLRLVKHDGMPVDIDLTACLDKGLPLVLRRGLAIAHRGGETHPVEGRVTALRASIERDLSQPVLGMVLVFQSH